MREPARRRTRFATLALLLSGCAPSLPPCDPVAAREVVYFDAPSDVTADDGVPMYVGQALFHQSCGGGAFCHSSGAEGLLRASVPKGLDWDVGVPCVDAPCNAGDERLARFVAHFEDLRSRRHRLWTEIERGHMPPGHAGRAVAARIGTFRLVPAGGTLAGGTLLPTLDSKEGRDALGNWLACGAPAVATALPASGYRSPGDPCDGAVVDPRGDCITRLGPAREAITATDPGYSSLEATWPSLYTQVFGPLCGTSCHGGGFPGVEEPDLGSQDVAYDTLLHDVTDEGLSYVVPGGSIDSHLVAHLDGSPDHAPMPPALLTHTLPTPVVDAIRRWIDTGAAP